MRSAEVTREKPPGTFRIVGIGDSHMFGWGVNQDETYLARLERKLNAAAPAGRRFEVLNFAAPGYNTVMEVAVFEHRALEFSPDLVVLHFIGNDMQDPHFVEPVRSWDPRDWYLLELARILADRGESEGERNEARSRRYRSRKYRHLSGKARFRQAMERLRDVAAAHRIPVVYLVYGRTGKHRAFVLSFGAELGFHVLEATPYFDAYLIARGHTPSHPIAKKVFDGRDAHPSKQGHEAYAEALFARLVEMGVVSGPVPALD